MGAGAEAQIESMVCVAQGLFRLLCLGRKTTETGPDKTRQVKAVTAGIAANGEGGDEDENEDGETS